MCLQVHLGMPFGRHAILNPLSAPVRVCPSVRGSAGGGADAFEARAGAKPNTRSTAATKEIKDGNLGLDSAPCDQISELTRLHLPIRYSFNMGGRGLLGRRSYSMTRRDGSARRNFLLYRPFSPAVFLFFFRLHVHSLLPTSSFSSARKPLPFSVRRYAWFLLFGLSGNVILTS